MACESPVGSYPERGGDLGVIRVTVNSSHGQLVTRSTRHKEAVNSSQANKQANIKAVLPQEYNYPYP